MPSDCYVFSFKRDGFGLEFEMLEFQLLLANSPKGDITHFGKSSVFSENGMKFSHGQKLLFCVVFQNFPPNDSFSKRIHNYFFPKNQTFYMNVNNKYQ